MDIDFGTVIYIILVFVYFIIQSGNKKKKKQQEQGTYEEKELNQRPSERRQTFEELLEEFTGQKLPKAEPVTHPIEFAEPIEVESKPYKSAYEIAKEKAEIRKREAEKEAAQIRSKFNEHFEQFEIEEPIEHEYADMFKDLDSAKKAFIASEVFNRKYN